MLNRLVLTQVDSGGCRSPQSPESTRLSFEVDVVCSCPRTFPPISIGLTGRPAPRRCPASSSVVRVLAEQGNRIAQIRCPRARDGDEGEHGIGVGPKSNRQDE